MIGKKLAHYEITGLLGKGGMGEVYRAEDTKLGRPVALKVLPAKLSSAPQRLSRFKREAKAVAALNHPNIVTLHSVDEAGGLHFLTMELVDGKPLSEIMTPGGLPLERILALAGPITDALASAHDRGIIHRDLKPGNIMVTSEGQRIKILDFGLAKLSTEDQDADLEHLDTLTTTREGSLLGTPFYMSPEQARSESVDHRTDIYSLGVILFEMATGKRPFEGGNLVEMLSAVLRDPPPPLSDLRPDLPWQLGTVINRCLDKSPEARYQTAREVHHDLEALRMASVSGITSAPSWVMGPAADSTVPGSVSEDLRRSPLGPRSLLPWVGGATLLALVLLLVFWNPFQRDQGPGAQSSRKIVAVLPFENLGNEGEEYFAAGVTDEITSRLARINGLGVISRTSMQKYKDSQKSVREIGRELNTDYVLEGTIRWDNSDDPGRVRISPRLIRVSDDIQMWSDTYERAVTEIFAMQTDIASRIAEALDITLLETERQALSAKPTDNIAAYQAYLQGMRQLQAPGFSRESFELGVQMFERAITLDPGFALALARLSGMNSRMYHYGFDRSDQRLARAKEAADRALALDPDLPEAHLALGQYYYWGIRDYGRALAALEAARDRAPNNNEIWLTTAYVKRRQGDFESAIDFLERDGTLSPLDPNAFVGLGECYGTLRRFAEAEQAYQRGMALAPDDPYPYTELALLYLRWRGDTSSARATLRMKPSVGNSESCRVGFLIELLDRQYPAALDRLNNCSHQVLEAGAFFTPTSLLAGMTYQLMQEPERANSAFASSRVVLEEKLSRDPDDHRVHSALGLTYAGLGRFQEAIHHGRRAVELYPLTKDALEAPVQIINLALIYTMAGQQSAALEQLEIALEIPSLLTVAWLEKDPRWDPLRDNPYFKELQAEGRGP